MSQLKPQTQGHIDGLCSVYSVVNACKLLFDHSEKTDAQLFKALCLAISDLFPKIVFDGTEVEGVLRLLAAAQDWTLRVHKRELLWRQPLRRKKIATLEEYFAIVRGELRPANGERRAAIIGLGKPWDHWTVVRGVRGGRARYFDSWGFPDSTAFSYFTFDKRRAGEGKGERTLLMYHQTFVLSATPREGAAAAR
jgi:hypothetical protein